MACGRRWPHTTRCCAPRSRSTGAGCLSTPATVCVPRSPRRGLRWMPRWLRSGRWSCRCGWGWRPGRPSYARGSYFGAVLNRAARVMASGHGGQILVDDAAAHLLSSIDLVALGARRLRDIAKPVEMFQVLAVGLGSEFPPLATLDATPGNLRPQTTSLVGRESELAEVQEAVKAHRLVTLTGVGGVGKTRLATEVAARLADEFPDGVWVFELAAVTGPAAVPDAVARGAGHHPTASQDRERVGGRRVGGQNPAVGVRQLRARARRRRRCDRGHPGAVGDGANRGHQPRRAGGRRRATVAGALAGCRGRNRLFGGGAVRRAGAQCDATLLVGRRGRVDGGHRNLPTPRRDSVGYRVGSLADGVDDGRRCPGSSRSAVPAARQSRRGMERHHTLRHAVAWSYDLLDDEEKTLLERCSVFAGGFDLQSACAVAGFDDTDDYAILDLLDALRRKSLRGRRPARRAGAILDAGNNPPVRRGTTRRLRYGGSGTGSDRPGPVLRGARSRCARSVGQPPTTGGLRLVPCRAGQLADGVPVGR